VVFGKKKEKENINKWAKRLIFSKDRSQLIRLQSVLNMCRGKLQNFLRHKHRHTKDPTAGKF
jgi:hypothetical protein